MLICVLKHEEVKKSFVIKLEAGRRNQRKLQVVIWKGLLKVSLNMEESGRTCRKVWQSSRRNCWGVLGFGLPVVCTLQGNYRVTNLHCRKLKLISVVVEGKSIHFPSYSRRGGGEQIQVQLLISDPGGAPLWFLHPNSVCTPALGTPRTANGSASPRSCHTTVSHRYPPHGLFSEGIPSPSCA